MGYREQAPSRGLSTLVAGIWAFPGGGNVHRVLPDGCMDLVALGGELRVVGAMQSAIVVPPSGGAVMGIRLRPGEAARLFAGLPKELTDGDAPLAELWGDAGRQLADGLLGVLDDADARGLDAAAIVARTAPIVEHALRARLASHGYESDLRMRAAARLLGQGSRVHEAAAHVELSERQLARRFEERVGLSPKLFARVRRLQRASLLMRRGRKPAEVAALAGYADQAHFTREAHELSGVTPGELAIELCDGLDTSVPVAL